MDYKEFVSKPKSLLISPAGYGKTYTIAVCLKYCVGKQLILTHTHAGIASIKEKIRKANIPNDSFHIETITSYAQKYVKAFYRGTDIPEQENHSEYYPFIIKKACLLVKRRPISLIIASTYSGLFVDEYQDCTLSQHDFILALSEILPTHILGDPLQGIFEFKEPLVNFEHTHGMSEFLPHIYRLEIPERWKRTNMNLGNSLKSIRASLEAKEQINLGNYQTSIEVIQTQEADLFNRDKIYNKRIWKLLGEESLLIIHPTSGGIGPRLKILENFNNSFTLVEAIDDKDFYSLAAAFDTISAINIEKAIRDIIYSHNLFTKTALNNLFNEDGLKRKRTVDPHSESIKLSLEKYKVSPSFDKISEILKLIKQLPGIKCYRPELLYAICSSLETKNEQISVKEAMFNKRNQTRRVGRKVHGKCLGTTLLTKGLEFDTVVILDAHKFTCPKNLYVALTRATKKLIIFTKNRILSPIYS